MRNIKQTAYAVLLWGAMFLVGACSDDDNLNQTADLSITAVTYSGVTYSTATVSATISGNSLSEVVKRGFCYSTSPEVDINASLAEASRAEASMTCTLTGLTANTTYYVKAFAVIYNAQPVYSSEISFTTSPMSGDEELAAYVAPTYADDYTGIAGWDNRDQWNLANVHDPSVVKADDGYYYMYQTDASYGNAHDGHGHFHARRSTDLVNWEYLGATMDYAPGWVKTKLNEIRATQGLDPIENPTYGYWAPVVRKVSSGKYRMYYSIVIDNYIKTGAYNTTANFDNSWTERSFIGMMETSDPAGNVWEDKGMVICSSSDKGMNDWYRSSVNDWSAYFKYNCIDPSYIISNGEHWLIYGSWHSGIAAVQLNPETGLVLNDLDDPWDITEPSTYGQLIYTRSASSRWQGSEAPEIVYNPQTGYYYLFMAYDELSVAYNTRVARATSITGPYYGIDGTNVSEGGEMYPVVTHPYKFSDSYGWVGISHCAVFDDGNNNWYYASQGRLPADISGINASNAVMMGHVRSIRWTTDGWPLVMPERYGAVPQIKITESELLGDWEHIDLSYSYGNQKASSVMTLSSDYKITEGTWKNGTWSFDEDNQILTANGVSLYLQREVDWEADPRTHTIVYAAYNGTKTYWGKKVQ